MNKSILPIKRRSNEFAERRDYASPVLAIQDEMNRMFDRFFDDPFDLMPFESPRLAEFSPRIDVSETDKEIVVKAELPGMDEKDINLSLEQDSLVISGEKKTENEEKGKNFHRVERSFGSFSRVIPLPMEVEVDKVEAEFKKGLLTITLPKPASAVKTSKKITIKAN
jgi:HSP20 family protein